LRGETLRAYATSELQQVIDMTPFIAQQRSNAPREHWASLLTPVEHVYRPTDPSIGETIGLDAG